MLLVSAPRDRSPARSSPGVCDRAAQLERELAACLSRTRSVPLCALARPHVSDRGRSIRFPVRWTRVTARDPVAPVPRLQALCVLLDLGTIPWEGDLPGGTPCVSQPDFRHVRLLVIFQCDTRACFFTSNGRKEAQRLAGHCGHEEAQQTATVHPRQADTTVHRALGIRSARGKYLLRGHHAGGPPRTDRRRLSLFFHVCTSGPFEGLV